MRVDEPGGAPGIALVEFHDVVVSEMIAGPEHCEAPVKLRDDGVTTGGVHDTIQRAERDIASKTLADALNVAPIDGEAIASHQFANFGARFEAGNTLLNLHDLLQVTFPATAPPGSRADRAGNSRRRPPPRRRRPDDPPTA